MITLVTLSYGWMPFHPTYHFITRTDRQLEQTAARFMHVFNALPFYANKSS